MTDTDTLDRLPFPVLIGDIGGTNARFGLIEAPDTEVARMPNVLTAAFVTIEDAIAATIQVAPGRRPRSALLALAAPIAGEHVALTNCHWVVDPKRIVARFGLEEMILVNDFEALSLSLPGLGGGDIEPIGGGAICIDAAKVVVGPGTGLGAGALVHGHANWIPVPGEGGHIDLAPVSDRDFAIWPHVAKAHGRVSGETLLCGAGMVRLYRGVCATDGIEPTFSGPAEIVEAGLSAANAQATETLALFATYLGRLAGNLALVFMAHGGVYLAGGISTKIAPALKSGAFREAFLDKAPHRALLEKMSTSIIIKHDAALAGIADFARTPALYEVDLAGRRWRM